MVDNEEGSHVPLKMLTENQLAVVRSAPDARRVAKAIALAGVTQRRVGKALGVSQAYVSDVARRRYPTITVESACKFGRYLRLLHRGSVSAVL